MARGNTNRIVDRISKVDRNIFALGIRNGSKRLIFIRAHIDLLSTGGGIKFPRIAAEVQRRVVIRVIACIDGWGAWLEPQVAIGRIGEEWVSIEVSHTGVATLDDGVGNGGIGVEVFNLRAVVPKDAVGEGGGVAQVIVQYSPPPNVAEFCEKEQLVRVTEEFPLLYIPPPPNVAEFL